MDKHISDEYPQEYKDGFVTFFYQDFFVDENVLIPRYETETLVRFCRDLCREKSISHIYDIGTGSGIIPLSLSKYTDAKNICATDISEEALQIAQKNAHHLGHQVDFFQGHLLDPIRQKCITNIGPTLITANLPYVGTWEKDAMSPDTEHEPDVALFGDSPDGFDIYREFFSQLHSMVSDVPMSLDVVVEFGMWQRDLAQSLFEQYGWKFVFFSDERDIQRFAHIWWEK